MGQKCEWCRLEMGSGWHLIRYFYEKKAIIILLCWVHALPSPLGAGIVQWLLYWLPRIKTGARNFIQGPVDTMLQHLGSYSVSPGHSGDGWSLLMVNVNFCVGLRVTFLLSSSRQRSHCQAKLNFLTKEGAVVGDESGRGRPGISWQSLTEETDNSSLHFKMSWHETGLGDHPSNATRFKDFGT